MKSKNLITRILFSLFAIALLAGVSVAQTAPAKSAKPAKTSSAMAAPADADLLELGMHALATKRGPASAQLSAKKSLTAGPTPRRRT